jgi:hypothetical protein
LLHKKKKNPRILDATLQTIEKNTVCQTIHLGTYDTEPITFKMMEEYCEENGYNRASKVHTEIYISDPRKVSPEKLKTTLRFNVNKK